MTYRELWQKLVPLYGDGEARTVARLVFASRLGMSLADIYTGKDTQLSANEAMETEKIAARLLRGEPVQYVLGEETFCGRCFAVGPGVLIPRPETALLAGLASEAARLAGNGGTVLDVGTGSGCIAVTVALDAPCTQVTAWDISEEALAVARDNARRLGADVVFERRDALRPPCDGRRWNVIVSNPPYVCERERGGMEPNVLDYEPASALFVPDDDPLRFYVPIASYAASVLRPDGVLLFEINPLCAVATARAVGDEGFGHVEVVADMFGRQRFIKATRQ